ncbi:universal stress protein [Arthrobacter sp. VKM Ac-2550]|uniref:universal stress protein n=1 Tax=Crystallibacter permensis TaxID=1938888 RepID=UPI0008A69B6E|nr:universal stress protein [Arthrobacter sp. VKM Ac-2550]AOY70812.1 universal stress protein [Arthrobacter sp. ZXY-2]MCW2134195.1 Nucleotide-binding universal stress protein, UspA family [Arthrobacter sp. VKM Ac-2550]
MDNGESFQVVVGLDGSDGSRAALDWAVSEARLRRGKVRAVTAWQPPAVTAGMEGLIWDPASFEAAAKNEQTRALKRVPAEDVPISRLLVQGSPAAALLDASKDADLLVVGSRGLGGFSGLLLGSVSTHLIHHAVCPVLVVRPRQGSAA